jgi:hypothetical protein
LISGTVAIRLVSNRRRTGVWNDEEVCRTGSVASSLLVSHQLRMHKPRRENFNPFYRDSDGYQVLSSIIEARTEKLKNGSVSIFHQTVSGDALGEIRAECASRLPREFQSALEDFGKKAQAKLLLQQQFSIHKEYRFTETMVGVQTGIYSVSAVAFDENKTRAIVLVQYLVRPRGDVRLGGYKMLYLLRRTETGWQEAADVPQCGQIY